MVAYSPYISKSKYLSGLQCHKLLWHQYNAKTKIPPVDAATQALFDQGHLIGEWAKRRYPAGRDVAKGFYDIPTVVQQSVEAVKQRVPLFEAGFVYKNAFARVDILDPVGRVQWDIIEVKSSTEVKEVHLHDLALQRYTYEGAGLSIRNCSLLHINNEYVRHGEIDPSSLFTLADVTKEVDDLLPHVELNLQAMLNIVRRRTFPDIPIGPYCNDPYTCPLHDMCWGDLPEHNVFTLYWSGQKSFDLFRQGVTEIVYIPDDVPLNEKQKIQVNSLHSNTPHIDKAGIDSFLNELEYPLYFLDFETFMTAIPLFENLRPYQQVPFQYSLHVVYSKNGAARHYGFLADGKSDPRPQILQRLQNELGEKGSIVAYNASFEKSRIREACESYPEYSFWQGKVEERFVDLLVPFRSFFYYHPDQKGSASIKAVLPALTGKTYEGMEIAEGETASLEFLRVTFSDVSEEERNKVRAQLEKYCKMDTESMIDIVNKLSVVS